jgi:hypothetical protein
LKYFQNHRKIALI